MDIFRQGGLSFEQWLESNDETKLPSEERDRLYSNLEALGRNSALRFMLNRLETEALSKISKADPGTQAAEDAHRDWRAAMRLRRVLEAAVAERAMNSKTKRT